MFRKYSNSHFSDRNYRPGDFVLSSVSKDELKRYGIAMTVKEFKNKVVTSGKFRTILTGGMLSYRHTRVYNYNDFKNLKKQKLKGKIKNGKQKRKRKKRN